MRLICPSCGAQYEVDGAMIPAGGRDVQCSSCGHTWLQQSEAASGTATDDSVESAPAPPPEAPPAEAEPHPATVEAAREKMPPSGPTAPEELPGDEGPDHPETRRRRELDATTRAILREEAERETTARQKPRDAGLESQPDLGLDRPPSPAPEATKDTADGPPETQTGSRRDRLPDIEEINSTLTATSDRQSDGSERDDGARQAVEQRKGFRIGFSIVLLVAAALILLYVFAPPLADAVPSLEPQLASYVSWVNEFRASLDGWLQAATASLMELTSGAGG